MKKHKLYTYKEGLKIPEEFDKFIMDLDPKTIFNFGMVTTLIGNSLISKGFTEERAFSILSGYNELMYNFAIYLYQNGKLIEKKKKKEDKKISTMFG